ncbi:hypothetical protein [Oerskovia enterophila]|uniref:Uncharacterized protein n=1 Tax=Oerskovia enterophila TaxID=43678 RepID=A0ABX2Y9A3_9CELL|nr:hypothetical protein [Oerskovia enterophila]OCI32797.1 hypothetical protein OERS_03890 [Oerskovia enterophila]
MTSPATGTAGRDRTLDAAPWITRVVWTVLSALALMLAVSVLASAAQASTLPATSTATSTTAATRVSAAASTGTSSASLAQGLSQASNRDLCLGSSGSDIGDSSCLPLNRWADATTIFHHRLGSKVWDDAMQKVQRDGVQSLLSSIGTFEWQLAANVSDDAVGFDLLQSAGFTIDQQFATVGDALVGNGEASVVGVIIVASIVATLVRGATSGGRSVGKLLKSLVTLGVLGVMITGATQSTASPDGFKPGLFSPGWFITTANNTVALIADGPTRAIVVPKYTNPLSGDTTHVTCADYVSALNARAKSTTSSNSSSTPLVISQMWVNSGLQSWAKSQYGASNDYGQYVYCHQLELNSQIGAGPQTGVFSEGTNGKAGQNQKSIAFNPTGNVETDNTLIAWGACHLKKEGLSAMDGTKATSWDVDANWSQTKRDGDPGKKGGAINPEMCATWWSDPGFDSNSSALEYENGNQIAEATSGNDTADVRDYLLTLQGRYVGSGMVASFAYVISGAGVLLSFGLVSLALMIGKIAQVVMMLGLAFVMVMSLWVGKADDAKVAKYVRSILGTTIFVAGASLLLAILTLMTDVIVNAGVSMMGSSSLMGVIWTGVAPLIAMGVIAMVFKSAGAPSPFKLGSALAFGAAAGGVGGVVASRLSGAGDRARTGAKAMAGRAAGGRGYGSGAHAGSGRGRSDGVGANPLGAASGGAAGAPGARRGKFGGSQADIDMAKGRRSAALGALGDLGVVTGHDVREAQRDRMALPAEERREADRAGLSQTKEIRRQIKTDRALRNDKIAEANGWKGARPEGASAPRLMSRDWASRQQALDKGKALAKVQDTMDGVRRDPARTARLGLKVAGLAALIAATGGVAAPILAGAAVVRGVRGGAVARTARSARGRVSAGINPASREEYMSAVYTMHNRAVSDRTPGLDDRAQEQARTAVAGPGAGPMTDKQSREAEALKTKIVNDERREASRDAAKKWI